jgi:hypothetical protein
LPANQQVKVLAVKDVQLARAEDMLNAVLIYEARNSGSRPQKVAAR